MAPSSVAAILSETSGVRWRMKCAKASLSSRASAAPVPTSTSMPASRSIVNPLPCYQRIGIGRSGNHASHAGLDQRARARPGATIVAARLERDIRRGAACCVARFRQSDNFGMIALRVLMEAAADDVVVANDHAADGRIGRCEADALARQLERALHPLRSRLLPDFRLRSAAFQP